MWCLVNKRCMKVKNYSNNNKTDILFNIKYMTTYFANADFRNRILPSACLSTLPPIKIFVGYGVPIVAKKMRIFQILFRQKHMPNGHIYRGKYRLVKPVTKEDLSKMKLNFEIEERNMFLLRHPYLTSQQSNGHSKALQKKEQKWKKIMSDKQTFYENVTLESRLGHLRYKEAWD